MHTSVPIRALSACSYQQDLLHCFQVLNVRLRQEASWISCTQCRDSLARPWCGLSLGPVSLWAGLRGPDKHLQRLGKVFCWGTVGRLSVAPGAPSRGTWPPLSASECTFSTALFTIGLLFIRILGFQERHEHERRRNLRKVSFFLGQTSSVPFAALLRVSCCKFPSVDYSSCRRRLAPWT